MRRFHPSFYVVAGLVLVLLAAHRQPLFAQDQTAIPVIDRCLAVRVFGQSPRGQIDIVASRVAAGEWSAPVEGDELPLPDGQSTPWATISVSDGRFEHELLQGGYASFPIESPAEQVLVLQIRGRHRRVFVNGRTRVGNVYDHGHVRLPVLLKEGMNELLVHCMTGSLTVSLEPPGGPAVINTADVTLPDLIVDRETDVLAGITIINASSEPLSGLRMQASGEQIAATLSDLPVIAPLTVRKVPFRISGPAPATSGTATIALSLTDASGETVDKAQISLDVRQPFETHRRTFLSGIDDSVQYYAVTPARPIGDDSGKPALFLTLHGAGVQALGQARAYSSKSWGHIVAATNRSPWGFDWEDWGRMDALEVLADAQQQLGTDPRRTYLTGHSMGGHGTWHVGATYPDRFAAIGPSAGWISFSSYGGRRGNRDQKNGDDPVSELLRRATSPSDTLTLSRNHLQHGVYILHGADDDNVPPEHARRMREELSAFHHDVSFHEEPGKGHWWNLSDEPGADCVDWAPMFDLFARRVIPAPNSVRDINFTTANPGISAGCQWCEILAQRRQLQPATVDVRFDPGKRRFVGTTDNVARLTFDMQELAEDGSFTVELDGQTLETVMPADDGRIYLHRPDEEWATMPPPTMSEKGPHRYGTFKDAFRNGLQFVYGTHGEAAENEATYDKARLDAESFWYRGNGAVELIADRDFDPGADPDGNVILYGNSDTNSAWNSLLADCPVHVADGELRVGERAEDGDDLCCLLIRPRLGSDQASVGAIGATGAAGMRMSMQITYLRSRAAYPDWTVFAPVEIPGSPRPIGTGYFGLDWSLENGESAWR